MKDQHTPPHPSVPPEKPKYRFLRLVAVCEMCGLSRSQIYRMQAAGLFPKSVKLGQSASAWLDTEVAQWQADRVAASRPQTEKKLLTEQSDARVFEKRALAKLRARMADDGQ